MKDYDIVNRRTGAKKITLEKVIDLQQIPQDHTRAFFRKGSCKINNKTYDIKEVKEKR